MFRISLICAFWLVFLTGKAQDYMFTQYKTIENYGANVLDVSVSPKNNYFCITTIDNGIELLDKNFNKIWSYKGKSDNLGSRVAFSSDEKYLFFSKYQSAEDIVVLNISEKRIITRVKAHSEMINAITLSSDNQFLASASYDKKIKVWKWANEKLELATETTCNNENFQHFRDVRFSKDNKYLVGVGITNEIIILENQKGTYKDMQRIPEKFWMSSVAIHPSNKYIFTLTSEKIKTYEQKGNQYQYVGEIDCFRGSRLLLNNKGTQLIVGKENGETAFYSCTNGQLKEVDNLSMHNECILGMSLSNDEQILLTGGADKKVIVWTGPNANLAKNTNESKKGDDTKTDTKKSNSNDLEFDVGGTGNNYLLIIGVNEYKYWNKLENATKDAQDVKKVLLERYNFEKDKVFEVYNEQATSKNILNELGKLRDKITDNDNLLIYFSGHGFYNAAIEEGFWIPVDARKGEETDYLANSTLLKYIKAIKARHIFLIADACFSGALFTQGNRGYIENVEQFKSRWGLASGRLEYVSDGQLGKNSPFATYIIKYLKENHEKRFPASTLIQYVKVAVSNNSEQTPIGQPLKNVGDEGGEFIFYLK